MKPILLKSTDNSKNKVNNLKLKYDPLKEMLIVKSTGSVRKTDILNTIKKLPVLLTVYPKLNILLDLRNTDVKINVDELKIISDNLKQTIFDNCVIRIAKIVNQPIGTALAILFQKIIRDLSHLEFEIFSTKSAAYEWLNISKS